MSNMEVLDKQAKEASQISEQVWANTFIGDQDSLTNRMQVKLAQLQKSTASTNQYLDELI